MYITAVLPVKIIYRERAFPVKEEGPPTNQKNTLGFADHSGLSNAQSFINCSSAINYLFGTLINFSMIKKAADTAKQRAR